MRCSILVGAAAGLLSIVSPSIAAADYPKQPLQIIVPFTPGGNTDLLARIIAERLQARFNETVTVINRSGAGTNIGAAFVASSRPDGYTMLLAPPASYVVNQFIYSNLSYDQNTAFTPVSLVARFPNVLVVHPSSGMKSIQDLIDRAKANQGKVEYASAGIGSASHLAGALFGEMAKININHIPYKGTSQSLQDLVGARVAFTIDNLGPILPFIQSGQLNALGVSTKDPVSLLPGVAPIGTVLNGYQASSWNVMAVPAGTPKDVVEKLSSELDRILRMPDVIEKMRSFGSEPVGGTPEEVAAFIKGERTLWETAVKAAQIKRGEFN